MALFTNKPLSELLAPSGPLQSQAIRILMGRVTLAAGAADENLGLAVLPISAQVYASRRVAIGVLGNLSCVNDGNGHVLITSSNAGDTSSVDYFAIIIG